MLFRIILMRHGQAVSTHQKGDFFRPLTALGTQQVRRSTESILALNWHPHFLLCSEAIRTMQTAEQVQDMLPQSTALVAKSSLYLGDLRHITHTMRSLVFDDVHCILLVGHNPGWSMAISELSGTSVHLDVAEAGLLSIKADSWEEALQLEGLWSLEHLVRGNR